MELRELGDRLFRLHAKLIIGAFLVGLLGGLAVYLTAKPQYQASTTLVMGAQDPQSAEEAAVLADTARGIATGPQLVSKAISGTGATRNEQAVAAAINVQALGNSGVLTLSVTDSNPRVAVRLANGLTARVVNTRIALIENGLASSLRGLAQQEASTDAQIRRLNTRIQTLAAQTATLSPQANGPALTQLAQLQARLTSLQQEAIQIAVQRNKLLAQQGPKTTVLDRAVSATRVRSRGLINALLGGILGLVVGIALAGAREMLRPSLVGAHAISRAIGTPLLGEVTTQPDNWTLATLPDAGTYVELAADAQHMYEVRFAALEPGRRRGSRVRMLEGPLHKLRFGESADDAAPGGGPRGLVVKAIPPARRAEAGRRGRAHQLHLDLGLDPARGDRVLALKETGQGRPRAPQPGRLTPGELARRARGGRCMRNPGPASAERIPFARTAICGEAVDAVTKVLTSGWLTTGPQVAAFEEEFSHLIGAQHAVAVSSCTAALELSLRSLRLPPGAPVLVPTITFCGAVNAILHAGLRPVLMDAEPRNADARRARRRRAP